MSQETRIGNPIPVGIICADGEVKHVTVPEQANRWPESTGFDTLILISLKIALTTSLVTIAIAFNPLVAFNLFGIGNAR